MQASENDEACVDCGAQLAWETHLQTLCCFCRPCYPSNRLVGRSDGHADEALDDYAIEAQKRRSLHNRPVHAGEGGGT